MTAKSIWIDLDSVHSSLILEGIRTHRLPNLRRIAVVPVADVAKSAELIGTDYVFSWRPNPADVMCCGFYPDLIRRIIREGMEAAKDCIVDITLKDVQTIEHEPWRLREWVRIVRDITDDHA